MSNNESTNRAGTNSMSAIRIGREHMSFIKNNEKLCKEVGSIVVMLEELRENTKTLEKILNDEVYLESLMEKGTKEEFQRFLNSMRAGLEYGVKKFDNLPDDVIKEIIGELGEGAVHTQLDTDNS